MARSLLLLPLLALLASCAVVKPRPVTNPDPSYPGDARDLVRCQDKDDLKQLGYSEWPTSWLDACTKVGTTWQRQARASQDPADLAKAEAALRRACPASAEAANGSVAPDACVALSELLRQQGREAEARAALEDFTCAAEPNRYPKACRWLADAYLAATPQAPEKARALYHKLCASDPSDCTESGSGASASAAPVAAHPEP